MTPRLARTLAAAAALSFTLAGCAAGGDKTEVAGGAKVIKKGIGNKLVFMDGGVIVEEGRPADVLSDPQHERTQSFLSKVL